MIPDLSQTSVVVIVFAMHQCPACEEFLPMFLASVAAHQQAGEPFVVWQPGVALSQGDIPVLLYDAASENEELQALADRLKIGVTPTTCIMTRSHTMKVEGGVPEEEVERLLRIAHDQNA